MRSLFASRTLAATTISLALGVGCGSSGGGCSGLRPLPAQPSPFGLPATQVIEGGIQARITQPGVSKLATVVTNLIGKQLGAGICAIKQTSIVGQPPDAFHLVACDQLNCAGLTTGCRLSVALNSADRPPPNNIDDGADQILVNVPDASGQLIIDAYFDFNLPLDLDYSAQVFGIGPKGVCTMDVFNNHYYAKSPTPVHLQATIQLGTDPTTGELTINLAAITFPQFDFHANGCSIVGTLFNGIGTFFSTTLGNLLANAVIGFLTPQINSILQNFLPKPPGLAGVVDLQQLLSKFHVRPDVNLETFLVAGGYVSTSAGGITLGVMSGLNSDRDESTRDPSNGSEANLCVPSRPTPDLSKAPWMLPPGVVGGDFSLLPAPEFSGNPDPMVMGATQDVAIGVSRTFLDLAGFHLFNSGAMCLAVGGDALPQLNAGTLSVLVPSLANLLDNRKAPLALVLRPQTPLTFTIGAGTMMDPLLHVNVSDLRIDFYAWVDERYVRVFTLAMDTSLGLNLTITKTPAGKPAIQPMLVGLTAANVKIRVSNTDLLQEPPAMLAQVFPSLIGIASGAIGGVVKPIALPALSGFSLDNLTLQKVQTAGDDFLAIYGSIVTGGPAPLVDWSDPAHPQRVGDLDTHAVVERVVVPPPEQIRALFQPAGPIQGARPTVTLALSADHAAGRPVEYGWRIDGALWSVWTVDAHPTLADDMLLLQGRHTIEVRSRVAGEWSTEDLTPASVEVLIDSVPPELHPALDPADPNTLDLNGFDLVSDTPALRYAWLDEHGAQSAWTAQSSISFGLAHNLTGGWKLPLTLLALDEAGNIGRVVLGPNELGFHGRTTAPPAAGCGCELGATDRGGSGGAGLLAALGIALLLGVRRRRAALATALTWVGLTAAGCGCENKAGFCSIDDDCAKMKCASGQLPQCQSNLCVCTPDLPLGDIGRFSSMCMIGPESFVAAYNTSYGDLMIGHVTPPAVVTTWDFVDGVPEVAPQQANSHVRGGVSDSGDDVGRYTSIQVAPDGQPVIAYFDRTHGTLKFASFGAIRWHAHTVDQGATKDEVGRWASLSIDKQGRPGIAYTATVQSMTASGMPEGQLRFAKAKIARPQAASDWTITVVDARPLPVNTPAPPPDGGVADLGAADGGAADGGAADMASAPAPTPLLPEGIGLMPAVALKTDGSPGIAYYDRTRGNLRYVELNPSTGRWSAPIILDGEALDGTDTGDVGLYPSLTFDPTDLGHISYEDASRDNLLYVNLQAMTPEVADDGYHPSDEVTLDGLPSPVFHLVGDSSSIQWASGKVVIAYQDSTVLTLRVAQRALTGKWTQQTVAGHSTPFRGSYGFYASLRVDGQRGIVSSYAINQQLDTPRYFVEVFTIDLGLIM